MAEVTPTRLECFREQKSGLCSEAHCELKDEEDKSFHPNLFMDIVDDGLKIWSEDGGNVVLPDNALKAAESRITYLNEGVA